MHLTQNLCLVFVEGEASRFFIVGNILTVVLLLTLPLNLSSSFASIIDLNACFFFLTVLLSASLVSPSGKQS